MIAKTQLSAAASATKSLLLDAQLKTSSDY